MGKASKSGRKASKAQKAKGDDGDSEQEAEEREAEMGKIMMILDCSIGIFLLLVQNIKHLPQHMRNIKHLDLGSHFVIFPISGGRSVSSARSRPAARGAQTAA